MTRKFGILALLTAAAFAVTDFVYAEDKKKDEVPAIKDCMAFQGKDGLAKKIETAAKAEKWEDAQKISAELTKLGEALGKNTPKKNADKKEDWEKLTKKFADQTAAVEKAAKEKKTDDVSKAIKTLTDNKNCMACHGTFKGK